MLRTPMRATRTEASVARAPRHTVADVPYVPVVTATRYGTRWSHCAFTVPYTVTRENKRVLEDRPTGRRCWDWQSLSAVHHQGGPLLLSTGPVDSTVSFESAATRRRARGYL